MRLFYVFYILLYYNVGFVGSADSDILGILRPSCRFELHTSLVQWDKAYQACKHRGLTLASFGDKTDLVSVKSFIEHANVVYTSEFGWLPSRKYWVGLHMESSVGGSSEFHWGDCVLKADIASGFDSLLGHPWATACGYVSLDSLILTACSPAVSLGFICENPSGEDSCFTTMSTTVYAMGYEFKTALTSSNCALHCLTSSSCGAVYVTAGGSCSMLQYNTELPNRLSASHLTYTHFYHRRFLNNDPYSLPFKAGLTEDELCSEPIGSPITTKAIGDVTTTKEINPTTTKEATTQQILEETTTDDVTTPQTTEDTTTDDVTTPQTTEDTTTDDVTTRKTTEDTTTEDITTPTTEDTTTEDVTTQTTEDSTTQDVTTPTTEDTTTEDITTPTTEDTTTEDITTQTTEGTTTNDIITPTTEDTTTNDITTPTTEDTTTNDITTQTREDTTTEDITTKTTEDTTIQDITTQTTEDTTTNDITSQTTKDTSNEDFTTQTTEDYTTQDVTTPTTEDTTTNYITTPTTEDTTTEDFTTKTTQDTTVADVTTQTTKDTTTEHVTTQPVSELSTPEQIPVSNSSSCGCTCVKKNITINEKIEDMVSKLKVDISVLSSTVRKKVCAEDPRPSARNLGILGIVLVSVMVGLIISMDVMRFFQNADKTKVMKKPSDKKIVPAT